MKQKVYCNLNSHVGTSILIQGEDPTRWATVEVFHSCWLDSLRSHLSLCSFNNFPQLLCNINTYVQTRQFSQPVPLPRKLMGRDSIRCSCRPARASKLGHVYLLLRARAQPCCHHCLIFFPLSFLFLHIVFVTSSLCDWKKSISFLFPLAL